MPTINKPKPKPSQRRKDRQKMYQLKQWRELSQWYRMNHPLCEMCEANGRLTPSEHVHHILSPFDYGLSEVEKLSRLLDPDNLMALCHECHNEIHQEKKSKKVDDKPKKMKSTDYLYIE